MSKKILAAGIVRDLEFDSQESLDKYINRFELFCARYEILDKFIRDDGSVIARIVTQYNDSDLIKLYE